MSVQLKPRTSDTNGRLWGARARDWADIQERTVRPVYDAVLDRTGIGSGTRYLDVGCGAGMTAQIAAARGAPCQASMPPRRFSRSRGSARRRAISVAAISRNCLLTEAHSTWLQASIRSSTLAIQL
jgi:hypothetical protein